MNLVKFRRNGRRTGKYLSMLNLACLVCLVGLIIAALNRLKSITGFPELGFISRWQRGELGDAGTDWEGKVAGKNRKQNEVCRQSQPKSDAFYDSIYDFLEAIHKEQGTSSVAVSLTTAGKENVQSLTAYRAPTTRCA